MAFSQDFSIYGYRVTLTNGFDDGLFFPTETLMKMTPEMLKSLQEWYRVNSPGLFSFEEIRHDCSILDNDYERWRYIKNNISHKKLVLALESEYTPEAYKEFIASVIDGKNPYKKPPPDTIKHNKKSGYIYLLKADNGFIKIGKAKKLNSRIKQLGVQVPMQTELIYSFETEDMGGDEKILHEQFAHKRDHGEWFVLNDLDIAEIKFFGGEDE